MKSAMGICESRPLRVAAVVEVDDVVGGVDTGHHHGVVAARFTVFVLRFDRLVPDEFGVDADDHLVAGAQLLLDSLHARNDAVLAAWFLLVTTASILYCASSVGTSAKVVPMPEFGFFVSAGLV